MTLTREVLIDGLIQQEDMPHDAAAKVIDEALAAGFPLASILNALFYGGSDSLILNTWYRKTFPKEGGPM